MLYERVYMGDNLAQQLKYGNLKNIIDFYFWSRWPNYLLPKTTRKLTKYEITIQDSGSWDNGNQQSMCPL